MILVVCMCSWKFFSVQRVWMFQQPARDMLVYAAFLLSPRNHVIGISCLCYSCPSVTWVTVVLGLFCSIRTGNRLCCILFPFIPGNIKSKSMAEFATWIRVNHREVQQVMDRRSNFRELMAHIAIIPVMISVLLSQWSAVMGSWRAPYCSLTCMWLQLHKLCPCE